MVAIEAKEEKIIVVRYLLPFQGVGRPIIHLARSAHFTTIDGEEAADRVIGYEKKAGRFTEFLIRLSFVPVGYRVGQRAPLEPRIRIQPWSTKRPPVE